MGITSIQQQILDEIIDTTLPKINGTGHYNHNVDSERIFASLVDPQKLSDYPALCIGDESPLQYTLLDFPGNYTTGTSPNDVTNGWMVEVWGFVKAKTDNEGSGSLKQKQISMYSDIVVAMMSDRTRGGHADDTELVGSSKRIDYQYNIGIILVLFSIKYDFNPTADPPVT